MEIEITAKRNTDMEMLLAKLYKWTPLENTFSANMNILVDNLPRVVGVHQIIETWVKWRAECIKKGIRYELISLNETLHRLVGLEKILLDIDKAIEIIRTSREKEIEKNLEEYFKIDDVQAEYVANIRLRNLNKDAIIKQVSEIEDLKSTIKDKEETLENDEKINELIIQGLRDTTDKYAQPRRTQIVEPQNITIETPQTQTQQSEETVENVEYRIIITKDGYLKKIAIDVPDVKIKDGDEILYDYTGNNNSEILVFVKTDAYKIYLSNVPVHSANDFGLYLPTHLKIRSVNIKGYGIINDKSKYMLIEYDNMKIAKININSYKTSAKRTKLENSLFAGAGVKNITTLFDDVVLELKWKNKTTMYSTSNMKVKSSRNSQGVTVRYETLKIKE